MLVATILYRLIGWRRGRKIKIDAVFSTWVICILALIFLSAEIQLLINALFYSPAHPLSAIQEMYYRTGLPILWGLCSFAFMWLGMRHKFKPLADIVVGLILHYLAETVPVRYPGHPHLGKDRCFLLSGGIVAGRFFYVSAIEKNYRRG